MPGGYMSDGEMWLYSAKRLDLQSLSYIVYNKLDRPVVEKARDATQHLDILAARCYYTSADYAVVLCPSVRHVRRLC